MKNPNVDCTYTGNVYTISHTGNPMVQKGEWSDPVVVLTRDSDIYSRGDQIKFVVKQEFDRHFQARLFDHQSSLSSPTFNRIYKGEVFENSNSGNPIIRHADWDKSVVIITGDSESFSKGDSVKFVVLREEAKRYQALLSHKAPVVKPQYNSKAVIPIHHDGKDNQSIGDTRSEKHAEKPIDERD